MLQDLRFALRLLAKDRWFTVVAVFALSLGIGVNATVFTLVNAVLIRDLPFPESDRLYLVRSRVQSGDDADASYPDLLDWRARSQAFSSIAAFGRFGVNLSDDDRAPEPVAGARLTANAFAVLQQQPLLGRDFGPDDERPGAAPVALIGHSIWTSRYGSDPGVVGRTIRVNGVSSTVVGVMPEGMRFPTGADLWMPIVRDDRTERRDGRAFEAFGRLRAGVTRAEAQAEMDGIAAALAEQYPETNKAFTGTIVQTFNERFNGDEIRTVFLTLLGAVGFVLLIACANVANLLLSRSARRAREMALRMALGATRWRVVRQLLLESVLIGVMGGLVGLLLAILGVRMFDAAVADVGKPYWIDFRMDFVVFGYLATICVATGIVFGLVPALQVSRTTVNDVLSEAGRGNTGGRRRRWLSTTMVVAEIGLTIVLLVGAGLMVRSFVNMYALDIGINPDRLMTMRLQLPVAKYPTSESRLAFYDALAPKLAAIPGAEAVAVATSLPPSGAGRRAFEIDGRPIAEEERPQVTVVVVSPSFFHTVGVALPRGRAFSDTDGAAGAEAVIVNDRFAARFLSDEDPVGRRIRFPTESETTPVWSTIVGVSPSIRHNSPQDPAPVPAVYVPHRQEPPSAALIVVRSPLAPGVLLDAARTAVQSVDRDQPVFSGQTVEDSLAQARWPFRVFGSLFAIFALIALVFSAVGLYAVMAYSVTERTQEIGVRMALGAGRRHIAWLVLRRGVLQLVTGLIVGLTGAYFISTVLASLLVQIEPHDPVTFVAIATLLSVVTMSACLIATRRAARLDPLVALRSDASG